MFIFFFQKFFFKIIKFIFNHINVIKLEILKIEFI